MPSWLPVVITIALFVVGIYNGTLGYFLKQHMSRVDDLEQGHKELREELHEFKQQVPVLYIRQDDYIRFQTALDHKLDKILDSVVDLKIGFSRQQEVVGELRQQVAAAQQRVNVAGPIEARQQSAGGDRDGT